MERSDRGGTSRAAARDCLHRDGARLRFWLTGTRPREFDLGILRQISCSPTLSLGFTECRSSTSGRRFCCPRFCSKEGKWTLAPINLGLPVISDTAAELLPRVALSTQAVMQTAREHGLQLNMASIKTEAVVDFRGEERQQVLEDLSREFPVIDGQWTPTEDASLRLVSTDTCQRHLVDRRQPVPFLNLPTFMCDQCDAACGKLRRFDCIK